MSESIAEMMAAEHARRDKRPATTEPTPLEMLETICAEIFERWDKDMRSGKLLQALSGSLQNYRADVTAVRAALSVSRPDRGAAT